MIVTPQRRTFVRWCILRELTEAQAVALLGALGRVGIVLDTTPGDVHLRLHTGSGNARLRGFMVLHGHRKAA
jgi:hypothetical protein